jgi:Flp pilus assembly protein TadD
VLQLHLQPTGRPEPLRVRVGLFFTDDPPTRAPIGVRLGSETIDIPSGEAAYVVQDSYVVPVDVDLLAVQPHAHNLARRMEAFATRPAGDVVPLIAIDDWDFRWQDVYRYAAPVTLPKGTRIAMRYTYDNSAGNPRNPHRPPARVVWGEKTGDEMGDLWMQLVSKRADESPLLETDVRRKAHAEDLAAYLKLLRAEPGNPLRHDAVASLYFDAGQIDLAIEHYRTSLGLNAASPQTHYNLGIALAARGRRADAIAEFEAAIRLDPSYAQAHNNLGAILYLMGRSAEALQHYERALALRPDYVEARTNLAALLSAAGRHADAVAHFREALRSRPDYTQALAGLAWIRATSFDAALRDGDEAVTLAERAIDAAGRRDLAALDALAAAYASVGRFDEATGIAASGEQAASAAGLADAAARFAERAALYRQHRPYRTSPQ